MQPPHRQPETAALVTNDFMIHLHIFFLLMNLLLWPSSGEVMAPMSVFQSRGSSRGRVQFTFWTVKCNCLAGELLRFGYVEKNAATICVRIEACV